MLHALQPRPRNGISPLDPVLGMPWPSDVEPVLSDKDAEAQTLVQAKEQGLLPEMAACEASYTALRK